MAFEELAARHGLEKIKTTGDALMATASLLCRNGDPVMAACGARRLSSCCASLPSLGPCGSASTSGPVVAGIVGHQKFSFDIWGDTVNVAARLAALTARHPASISAQQRGSGCVGWWASPTSARWRSRARARAAVFRAPQPAAEAR